MKQDTAQSVMVRLILATGLLLLFTWGANAESPMVMKRASEMRGLLESGEKKIALLALGDRVRIRLDDPEAVMPGDRLNIYESPKTSIADDEGEKLLTLVGRAVVTHVDKDLVLGVIEAAGKEIFAGSMVDHALSGGERNSRYFTLLKLISQGMNDPVRGVLTVALFDVTDAGGSETRLTEAVRREMERAFCSRPQIHCVDPRSLRDYIAGYGVATGASVGSFLREKAAVHFGADWFVTGQLIREEAPDPLTKAPRPTGKLALTVSAYDFHDTRQVTTSSYSMTESEYRIAGNADEVLVPFKEVRHGRLRIVADRFAPVNGRRVDALLVAPLDEYVAREYRRYLTDEAGGMVMLANVQMDLDGKTLKAGPEGVYYDDIISAGPHTLRVAATPSLPGNKALPIGRAMEQAVPVIIGADGSYESQVVLKVVGRQGLMVIDTRQIKQRAMDY